jgi:DNA replication and repair protein RecF
MTISRLTLANVRNYAEALITPGPRFVVFTGSNGAGKTNILEAVSLLVPGRGLRGASFAAIAQQGGPGGFAVAAQVDGAALGTGTLPSAPERRKARINGATAPITALSEWLSIVWLTPAMDRLFADTAGERRRFLDRLVLALDPAHAGHSTRYEAAMRQRNRLLSGEDGPDLPWLTALESQMALHATAIARARILLVDALNAVLSQRADGPFARAALSLDVWQNDTDLARTLADNRQRDAAAGRALSGPHRTDMKVIHAAKAMPANLCSTGEQKALLLGIVLGHAALVAERRGKPPLLLLDEVAAHLDPLRRRALFDLLAATGSQVWMTGTEVALFDIIGANVTHFTIDNGVICPL